MSEFTGQRVVMLGSGGSGMRGLAHILKHRGATIIGVDRQPGPGVLSEEQAAPEITKADLIIHTDALAPDHPLLILARAAHIPIKPYHHALGQLTHAFRTLAVTGTHGKSSTTSMLAHIFVAAGYDPTALVGAPVPAWNNLNARVGKSDWFIIEADEYRDHFLTLRPESAIISAIDFDHPDFFNSLSDVETHFSTFLQQVSATGVVVAPEALIKTFPRIAWPTTTQAVAPPTEPLDLVLPGEHMQYNAWLAVQLALHYGIDEYTARTALAAYPGLGRRFERLGHMGDMAVISDYGHHPTEIAATLAAARERYPATRICAVVEIHTAERLVEFFDAFVTALRQADSIILTPPFVPVGREGRQSEVAAAVSRLAEALRTGGRDVVVANKLSEVSQIMTQCAVDCGVAIAFSAGSLDGTLRTFVKAE